MSQKIRKKMVGSVFLPGLQKGKIFKAGIQKGKAFLPGVQKGMQVGKKKGATR